MLMCELEPMEYTVTMEDKMLNENEGESKMVAHDFFDDEEKMRDFETMSKAEFLKSYSYLTEEEYDLTEERYFYSTECPHCGRRVDKRDMSFTYDCHGIPFRFVCQDCWNVLMEKGFDGEHYTEADECIDWDY